jgi:ribosomal-protein-alanine N-acetyltransferase
VRPLRASDLPQVVGLEVELFGRGAWSYGMLAEELGGVGRWYVAAEEVRLDRAGPGDVVGYAGLWFDGEITQVMTLGVATRAQHCGIGSQLLVALVDRSRQLGATGVLLEVAVTNTAAITMYEKFGFVRLGLRKRYYQPEDVDAYTMRLDLTVGHEPGDRQASSAPSAVSDPAGAAAAAAAAAEEAGAGAEAETETKTE